MADSNWMNVKQICGIIGDIQTYLFTNKHNIQSNTRQLQVRVVMEPENLILKQLTTNILPSSILTLVDILPNEVCLEIKSQLPHHDPPPKENTYPPTKAVTKPRSKSKVTSKQYRIKFQNSRQFQQVYVLVNSYATRRAKLTQKNGALFVEKFKDISFSQILVEKQSQDILSMGLQKMDAETFRVLPALKIEEICELFANLHQTKKKTKNRTFQVQFHIKMETDNIIDIVKIIGKWINLCECESQLEKLSLYHQSVLLLSLQKNKQYGLSICLHRHSTNLKLCLAMLQLFVKYPIFVSVEFLDWEPSNNDAVNFVFANYHHRAKYLIKFGNYLEITELRLFINTTGMNRSEVAGIFHLLKQPGHYELVCHSSKQFFQEVVNIFLYKPLIYFKYFVPLTESQELQSAVEAMMQKADLLRKKVEVFMNMLKSPEKMELGMVIKLFLSLSKTAAQ